MNPSLRTVAILAFGMLLAAAFGGWLGVAYGVRLAHNRPDQHERIHHVLDLTADQDRELAALEAQFKARRSALHRDMDLASHDFANAISMEHVFGPRSRMALIRYHQSEEQLEEATIMHAQAMRAVLNAGQREQLDFSLRNALPEDFR